jgi:hypothetical protein
LLEEVDPLETRAAHLLKLAQQLEAEHTSLSARVQDLETGSEIARCYDVDRDDLNARLLGIRRILDSVHVHVSPPRDEAQEEGLRRLRAALDMLETEVREAEAAGEEPPVAKVASWLAATGASDKFTSIDERFQSVVLSCILEDQRRARERLTALLHDAEAAAARVRALPAGERARRRAAALKRKAAAAAAAADAEAADGPPAPAPQPYGARAPSAAAGGTRGPGARGGVGGVGSAPGQPGHYQVPAQEASRGAARGSAMRTDSFGDSSAEEGAGAEGEGSEGEEAEERTGRAGGSEEDEMAAAAAPGRRGSGGGGPGQPWFVQVPQVAAPHRGNRGIGQPAGSRHAVAAAPPPVPATRPAAAAARAHSPLAYAGGRGGGAVGGAGASAPGAGGSRSARSAAHQAVEERDVSGYAPARGAAAATREPAGAVNARRASAARPRAAAARGGWPLHSGLDGYPTDSTDGHDDADAGEAEEAEGDADFGGYAGRHPAPAAARYTDHPAAVGARQPRGSRGTAWRGAAPPQDAGAAFDVHDPYGYDAPQPAYARRQPAAPQTAGPFATPAAAGSARGASGSGRRSSGVRPAAAAPASGTFGRQARQDPYGLFGFPFGGF